MDRREQLDDGVEGVRAGLDGRQAEIWTAMPGLVQSFDPVACTVSVQPAIQGTISGEDGKSNNVDLPLLVDVPVVFPHCRNFALTFPIQQGDECLVVFASRCIDGWWQQGGVQAEAEQRMHDLSDGFAMVGPYSQKLRLEPPVDADNVQLRHVDGDAYVAMRPDKTIEAVNPEASVTLTPGGDITGKASASVNFEAPAINLTAGAQLAMTAPQITIKGNSTWTGQSGGAGTYAIAGALNLDGTLTSTGDQVAEGISTAHHTHIGCQGGSTGGPQ